MLLTIEVLFLRPFQCPFVRKPGQEVFGESLGRSSQWLSCPRQGTAGSEIPLKQLEPKATTNEYLEAPKERSNRPLLRSLSGAAERLLRVFRLVLLSWISSSTSSWLLQGRRCANICYHTKMRLPSAQAGSACCVRHCCLSKTKTSKRAGRSSLSRFCQDCDPNSAGAADVRLAKVHMKFPSAKINIHTAFVHCHKKIKPGAHVQVNPCLAHLHEK